MVGETAVQLGIVGWVTHGIRCLQVSFTGLHPRVDLSIKECAIVRSLNKELREVLIFNHALGDIIISGLAVTLHRL